MLCLQRRGSVVINYQLCCIVGRYICGDTGRTLKTPEVDLGDFVEAGGVINGEYFERRNGKWVNKHSDYSDTDNSDYSD